MRFLISLLTLASLNAYADNNKYCFGYSDLHRMQVEIRPLSGDQNMSRYHFRFFTYQNNELAEDFVAIGKSLAHGRGIPRFDNLTNAKYVGQLQLVVAGGDAQMKYTYEGAPQRADLACVDIE